MAKPTRYYVDYEDAALIARELRRHNGEHDLVDQADTISWEDFEQIEDARAFMQAQVADGRFAYIKERRYLVDETPPYDGVPAWTLWDSDDVVVED